MSSPEFSQFFSDLRGELTKLPQRPAKGELLRRAFDIPLVWPETEYPPESSMTEQFQRALSPWGGKTHLVKSESEAMNKIVEIVKESGARRLSRYRCPRLDALDWETALRPLNVEWDIPSPKERDDAKDERRKREIMLRLEKIEVGITDCDWAVAHTGTLVFRHDSQRNGYANLFPWTHIALAWRSQLVRTIQEVMELLDREQSAKSLQSNTLFITGPSRSGDIDLTVGQGAAGPGRFHAIIVDG